MATPYGYFHSYIDSISRIPRYCKLFQKKSIDFRRYNAQNRTCRRRKRVCVIFLTGHFGSVTILILAVTAFAVVNVML